jgi:hypothetical protein
LFFFPEIKHFCLASSDLTLIRPDLELTISKEVSKVEKMGRLRKKSADKAGAGTDLKSVPIMRRTVAYTAMTKDEAQRSIRTFYEAVRVDSSRIQAGNVRSRFLLSLKSGMIMAL